MIKIIGNWFFWYIILVTFLYSAILLNLVSGQFVWIPLILAFVPIFITAIQQIKNRRIGSEFFLVIASIIGLIGRQEQAITTILIIMLIAEFLEEIIESNTQDAIKSLVALIPTNVILKENNNEKLIPIDAVKQGMELIIKTGKRIPVDGHVVQGNAWVNEAALTGESQLKEKKSGSLVYAGSYIEAGSIVINVDKIAQETFFGKITAMVEQAQQAKAKIATTADKIAFYLIPSLLIFIVLVWIFSKDTQLAITLLVFGSPLELTLITPLAVLAGITAAFRHGILVKGGLALERFSSVDTLIFDKTGTVTLGDPVITDVQIFDTRYSKNEVITLAAIAEKYSDHVIAKAILKKAQELNLTVPNPDTYKSFTGHGVEVSYKGVTYFLGNKHFIQATEHANIPFPNSEAEDGFYSAFYLGQKPNILIAKLLMEDQLRPDAQQLIKTFKNFGIKNIILLSGDKQTVTTKIAQQLDIDKAYGNMFPDQKIDIVNSLQKQNHAVAMIGDGINDAPALKQANVGIALGAMGMEPAIEAADIVLMTNDLEKISYIYRLSRATINIIWQNIIFGFVLIHSVGFIMAFLKIITPVQAALLHAVPDLIILLNSARLARFK